MKRLLHKALYILRYFNELRSFRKNKNIHQLPDIFHYWSNKYLLPKEQKFGFNNPDEFFYKYTYETCSKLSKKAQILIISILNVFIRLKVSSALHSNKNSNFLRHP